MGVGTVTVRGQGMGTGNSDSERMEHRGWAQSRGTGNGERVRGQGLGVGTGMGAVPGCEVVLALLPPRTPLTIARIHPQTEVPLAPLLDLFQPPLLLPLLKCWMVSESTGHWD